MTEASRPERPPADADPEEVAEWRAEDFGWALATAMGEEATRDASGD
jgi:hypothetical protein